MWIIEDNGINIQYGENCVSRQSSAAILVEPFFPVIVRRFLREIFVVWWVIGLFQLEWWRWLQGSISQLIGTARFLGMNTFRITSSILLPSPAPTASLCFSVIPSTVCIEPVRLLFSCDLVFPLGVLAFSISFSSSRCRFCRRLRRTWKTVAARIIATSPTDKKWSNEVSELQARRYFPKITTMAISHAVPRCPLLGLLTKLSAGCYAIHQVEIGRDWSLNLGRRHLISSS